MDATIMCTYILMWMKYQCESVCCCITQGSVRGKSCAIVSWTTWWFRIKGAMAHLDRRPSQNRATQTVNSGIQLFIQVQSYSNAAAVAQWIRFCTNTRKFVGSNPWSGLYYCLETLGSQCGQNMSTESTINGNFCCHFLLCYS